MFTQYLERLRMSGKRYFVFQEMMQELDISYNAAKFGLYRLKKGKKVISPAKGLYVIVPPEHQPHGCIPAEELIPIIMNYLNAQYYVALLSAAAFMELPIKRFLSFK